MIAAVLLATAVLGLMSLAPRVASLTETVNEDDIALAAQHQVSEAIRQYADQSFDYLLRAFNVSMADDPNGPNTAPYHGTFSVDGLYDATGSSNVGLITFYTDETMIVPELGLPKDLNNSGDPPSDTDVSGDYVLLPFEIRVTWVDHRGIERHKEVISQAAGY